MIFLENAPFLFDAPHGQKRAADFDLEIERLSKRLRATTPTAEEALGFLLPHLLEMRRLYLGERQKVNALQEDNRILKQNNTVITQALRDQLTKKTFGPASIGPCAVSVGVGAGRQFVLTSKHSSTKAATQELAIKAYSRMSTPYTHQRTAPIKRMIIVALDSLVT